MGTDWTWGQALKAFAATGQKVTDSSEVGTDGGPSWFTGGAADGAGTAFVNQDFTKVYDVWWSFTYSTQGNGTGSGLPRQYVLGVNMDWPAMENGEGPLYRFVHQADQILTPLAGTLKGNEFVSLGSFDTASNTARWLEGRIQAAKELMESWARTIDNEDSNWQGSAAGVFKAVLEGHANELDRLRTEMINPRDFTGDIDQARVQLHQSLVGLQEAFSAWRNDRMAWPVNATHDALQEAMQGAHIEFPDGINPKVTSPYGDPTTQAFWDRVQSRAKQLWLANVHTKLDQPAQQQMQALERSYGTATASIPEALSPMRLKLPHSGMPPGGGTGANGTHQDPNKVFSDLMNKNATQTGGGGSSLTGTDPKAGTGTGGGPTGGTGTGTGTGADGAPPSAEDLKQSMKLAQQTPPDIGSQEMGGGTGGGLDAKGGTGGLDQLGGKGVDQQQPPGFVPPTFTAPTSGISQNGGGSKLTGPGGTGTGAGKSALVGPDGATLKDGQGKAFQVPTGSKINADGTITRPDGKLATDANGHKITVPPGAKIATPPGMGTGYGSGGHQETTLPNKRLSELLQRPPGTGGTGGDAPPPIPRGLKTFSGGGMGEGEGALGRNLARTGSGDLVQTRTGMGPRALRGGGVMPPAEEMAPPGTGRGTGTGRSVLPEATAMGRSTSSGTPMVPPMGGGAAPGGGQGEQERSRQTWVDEDEEVWGTDEGTTPGVIGR